MYFDHYALSGYMLRTTACRTRGDRVLYDTTWERARGAWVGYFGLSIDDYDSKKRERERQGFAETYRITCQTRRGLLTTFVMRK